MGAILLVVAAAVVQAQDPCDRLLRKIIDDIPNGHPASRINGGLERLASLEEQYGKEAIENVERVMVSARGEDTAVALEELLGKRSRDQAQAIFQVGASFIDEQARRGISRAAGLPPFREVEAGASVHAFLEKNVISRGAKEQFFREVDILGHHRDGVGRLLYRAGDSNNYGAVFELAADAKLAQDGRYGRLIAVDFDVSGNNGQFSKVDTVTETANNVIYFFQSKSSYNQSRMLGLDADIATRELELLVEQSAEWSALTGKVVKPVLMSNVGFDDALKLACDARDIEKLEAWVRIVE